MTTYDTLLIFHRDTAANWTAVNPILAQGEPGYEKDTGKLKIGDGTTRWVALGYQTPTITKALITATGLSYSDVGADAAGAAAAAVTIAETASDAAGAAAAVAAASAQKASNLSDVASAGTSRFNLHIPELTPAAAVATANLSWVTSSTPGAQTIDGYALQTGDHFLATAQSTGSQNGPWIYNGASAAPTRPATYPSGGSVGGATGGSRTIDIINGTVGRGARYLLQTNTAITIDTTATTWALQQSPSVDSARSLDGSFGLSAPVGVGYETVFQNNSIAYFQFNGVVA